MASIPGSYEASRERFRASLPFYQKSWPQARITSIPLTGQPDLTIEVISSDANQTRQKLLILTTGLHGIEGYVGSGILQLFTEEFLPRLDPETTGILLVHPINPFGMKYWTRVNKNNVDLNRNFTTDFESLKQINPHYEGLGYLLNPGRPLKSLLYEKSAFIMKCSESAGERSELHPGGSAHGSIPGSMMEFTSEGSKSRKKPAS